MSGTGEAHSYVANDCAPLHSVLTAYSLYCRTSYGSCCLCIAERPLTERFSLYFRAFAQELDFYNMQLDTALRKFQAYFRLPGEAQKIERLMEVGWRLRATHGGRLATPGESGREVGDSGRLRGVHWRLWAIVEIRQLTEVR